MRHVNYKSDFVVEEVIKDAEGGVIPLSQYDFQIVYRTNNFRRFIVSVVNGVFTNCMAGDNGSLIVFFDSHNLGRGYLTHEFDFSINNGTMPDRSIDLIIPESTDIELWDLDSDSEGVIRCEVIASYMKGERGLTPNVSIDITMLEPGSTPTVDKSGTNEYAHFQLGIPKSDKGDPGADGLNNAVVSLYARGADAPRKPFTYLEYDFLTTNLSGQLLDWRQYPPERNEQPLWSIMAIAVSDGTTASVPPSAWSNAVEIARDGAPGLPGESAYVMSLSNSNFSIPCYYNGLPESGAIYPTCRAMLYFGTLPTESGTFSLICTGISANVDSNGLITFSNITDDTATVIVSNSLSPNTKGEITITKVRGGLSPYIIYLIPSHGASFYREGQPYYATIEVAIYQGVEDITDTLHSSCFVWQRVSGNPDGDPDWNIQHNNIGNTLTLTESDLVGDTDFLVFVYDNHGELLAQKTINI